MNSTQMQKRTQSFALRVLRLCAALSRSAVGRMLADQLGRAAGSVGANYRAVRRARSRPDFVNKLGVVEEEADECCYWLEIIIAGGIHSAAATGRASAFGSTGNSEDSLSVAHYRVT